MAWNFLSTSFPPSLAYACLCVCLFVFECILFTLSHSVPLDLLCDLTLSHSIFRNHPDAAAAAAVAGAHINVCVKPTAKTLSFHKQIRLYSMYAECFSTIINAVFVFLCVYSICHNLSFAM